MPTSFAAARLVLTLLIAAPVACSLFSRNYECGERDDIPHACICRPTGSASARPGDTTQCTRQYDCCVEYEWGSWMVDDPHRGSGCKCWMLGSGETCQDALGYDRPGTPKVKSRPKSCPP